MAAPVVTANPNETLVEAIKPADFGKALAPIWDTFAPMLGWVVKLGIPALIVGLIVYGLFSYWSQHGVGDL